MNKKDYLKDNIAFDNLGRLVISDKKFLEKINGAVSIDDIPIIAGWDTVCNDGCHQNPQCYHNDTCPNYKCD